MTLAELARALRGKVRGKEIIAPLPGPRFRQVKVGLNLSAPGGWYARPDIPGDASIAESRAYGERRLALAKEKVRPSP